MTRFIEEFKLHFFFFFLPFGSRKTVSFSKLSIQASLSWQLNFLHARVAAQKGRDGSQIVISYLVDVDDRINNGRGVDRVDRPY